MSERESAVPRSPSCMDSFRIVVVVIVFLWPSRGDDLLKMMSICLEKFCDLDVYTSALGE